jgi:amino acid transporter
MLSAVVFVFFAYLGFEVLPTISEEVKDVRRTLPKALLISIAITSVLYILVAIAFTSALTHAEIVSAVESGKGALAVAAGKFGGNSALLALGIVALFSTANTILISAIGVSRMMYGMAITLIPLLVVGVLARLYGKMNYLTLCGLLAGSMTDPPALAFANGMHPTSGASALSYATVYPLVMFLRIISPQLLAILLWAGA